MQARACPQPRRTTPNRTTSPRQARSAPFGRAFRHCDNAGRRRPGLAPCPCLVAAVKCPTRGPLGPLPRRAHVSRHRAREANFDVLGTVRMARLRPSLPVTLSTVVLPAPLATASCPSNERGDGARTYSSDSGSPLRPHARSRQADLFRLRSPHRRRRAPSRLVRPARSRPDPRPNPGRTGIGLACPAGKSFGSALLQTSVAPSDDFGKRARAEHHHHHHRRRIGYRLP